MDFQETSRVLDDGDSDALAIEIGRLSEVISAGETAKTTRADLFRQAHRRDPKRWTQTWLAEQAGISQAAVSKALKLPGERSLEEENDPVYLVGRLLGLGQQVAGYYGSSHGSARPLARMVDKMIEEKMPLTSGTLRELLKQVRSNAGRYHRPNVAKETLEDIESRLPKQMPAVDTSDKTRIRLLLGFDHQRAQMMRTER